MVASLQRSRRLIHRPERFLECVYPEVVRSIITLMKEHEGNKQSLFWTEEERLRPEKSCLCERRNILFSSHRFGSVFHTGDLTSSMASVGIGVSSSTRNTVPRRATTGPLGLMESFSSTVVVPQSAEATNEAFVSQRDLGPGRWISLRLLL